MSNYTRQAEGCKPSYWSWTRHARPTPTPNDAQPQAHDAAPNTPANAAPHAAPNAHRDAAKKQKITAHTARSERRRQSADIDTRTHAQPLTPPHPRTMGGTRTVRTGGGEAHIGGVAHKQTGDRGVRRIRVGDRVVNASGRGQWLVGVVVGVIPADVYPAAWCSRHGFPALFRSGTRPGVRERYVVSVDGRLFTPETVRLYGD